MPGPINKPANQISDSEGTAASANQALALMIEALELLDRDGGANLAGAHLDLAIHRLRDWMAKGSD